MDEKTIGSQTVFSGRLLQVDVLEVALASGRRARREIVRHPGAIAAVVRRSDGAFLFVRQFRKALDAITLEIVAGTLDPGEAPEACAVREIREETGYEVTRLQDLGVIVPAPGYADERLHLFFAEVGAAAGPQDTDPDEHVEVVALSEAEFTAQVRAGGIQDSKTLACWLLWKTRGTDHEPE